MVQSLGDDHNLPCDLMQHGLHDFHQTLLSKA